MQQKKWEFIESEILRFISEQQLGDGDLLPSDAELAKQFDCSLQPVIRAMQELARRGVVKRGRGARTSVRTMTAAMDDHELSFTASVTEIYGRKLENRILDASRRRPNNSPRELEAHQALGLVDNSPFVVISRLRIIDEQPKAIHRAFLDPARFSRTLLSRYNFETESLIQIYQDEGFRAATRDTVLSAKLANEEEQEILGIDEIPVLEVRQKLYSVDPNDDQSFVLEFLHGTFVDWEYRILNRC